MNSIRITGEFGIVIRQSALHERGVSMDMVLTAMETAEPLDKDEHLISFGPSHGDEALTTFTQRLIRLGLVYYDDFFDMQFDSAPWCRFRAELAE